MYIFMVLERLERQYCSSASKIILMSLAFV